MVLDLGRGGLFRNEGLEQDTGRLSERWGQDGSDIKNLYRVTTSSGTVYTVTAGKRLFIVSLIVEEDGDGDGSLSDGGAGGTVKFSYAFAAAGNLPVNFSSPIYFDTDVFFTEVAGSTGSISLYGWEESL